MSDFSASGAGAKLFRIPFLILLHYKCLKFQYSLLWRFLGQWCQCQIRERPDSTSSPLCECSSIIWPESTIISSNIGSDVFQPFCCGGPEVNIIHLSRIKLNHPFLDLVTFILPGTGTQWWDRPMWSRIQRPINRCRSKAKLNSCNTYTGGREKIYLLIWSFQILEDMRIFTSHTF